MSITNKLYVLKAIILYQNYETTPYIRLAPR